MTKDSVIFTLEEGIAEIPALDCHTHLDASHLAARGLHDILLYHMVVSDLYSAGCPSGDRLSEHPDEAEAQGRLAEAIPYLEYIQNTSCFWGVKIILKDLYDWTEPITGDNWQKLDALIQERSSDPSWPRETLRKANIQRACTELWRGHDGSADDIFQYSLEWAFFSRTQWGQNDIPLFELEKAWNEDEPSPPLPVTLESRPELSRTIHNISDVHEAIRHYCNAIPYDKVISTAQHFSTDINYRLVSGAEMESALRNREEATIQDRDVYANYIVEALLTELDNHTDEIVYQFSLGAEPLPYETGSKIRQDTIFQLAGMFERHPRLRFQVFLASGHANQALCTLARELPNFSLAGYWWHNFFPSFIRKVMSERLDMVSLNKQVGFFSDAYTIEWVYAKSVIVRKQLAEVLAQKVTQGQYTVDEALSISRQILFATPQSLLGVQPAQSLS
jgi:glucuronate isomerase